MDLSVFLNTLLFKSAATPGLAKVLLEIFDFEGMAIRRRKARNLVGGPDNEYGHCCGLGRNGKRQTFREMQLQYGKLCHFPEQAYRVFTHLIIQSKYLL